MRDTHHRRGSGQLEEAPHPHRSGDDKGRLREPLRAGSSDNAPGQGIRAEGADQEVRDHRRLNSADQEAGAGEAQQLARHREDDCRGGGRTICTCRIRPSKDTSSSFGLLKGRSTCAHGGVCHCNRSAGAFMRWRRFPQEKSIARCRTFLLYLEGMFRFITSQTSRNDDGPTGAIATLYSEANSVSEFLFEMENASVFNKGGSGKGGGKGKGKEGMCPTMRHPCRGRLRLLTP